jgi:CheY-like chemotaxis protein
MKPAPRIAVVDDELIVAKDLEATLRGFGYEVPGTAPSAREAIALAGAAKPDLMLMDIRLSGEMDGIEAARHIQRQHDVPIVFVTAYADDATLARAREAYPYGYLVKPVQDNALRSTVATALHRHRAERQARQTLDRQRTLCDALGHLLWTAQADGRAETFNQRWFDYTGLSAAASRGFGWVTALHPADMRRCLNQWREAVARKAGFETVCTVMRAGNAGGRRHLLRVVALPDAPGEPQWLATLTDIHDYEKRPEASRLAAAGAPMAPVLPDTRNAGEPAVAPPTEATGSFRDRFCAAHNCAPEAFADRVLLLSLYFHALPLAVLLWPFRRRLFAVDFDLIEQAGCARWGGDIPWQLGRMCPPEWTAGPWRRWLRLRVSVRRLAELVTRSMAGAPPA